MEIRFHNPYRHSVLGLLAELTVFVGFMAVMAVLALVFSWLA
ncbi:MAG: hypothetical protein ACYC6J_06920 [Coriobacteriia bacterium]